MTRPTPRGPGASLGNSRPEPLISAVAQVNAAKPSRGCARLQPGDEKASSRTASLSRTAPAIAACPRVMPLAAFPIDRSLTANGTMQKRVGGGPPAEVARGRTGETQMSELDYWNGRMLKGAISRREFMGRAAALGASSAAISSMLAKRRHGHGGRNAQERRHAEARPRRRQHHRQPRLPHHQQLRDDQRQPRALELPRRMGRGRQAASGAGGELGADRTARRTGSSSCARA